jgi:thioredoxin-related protein
MPDSALCRSAASGLTRMARWLAGILACVPLTLFAAPPVLSKPTDLQREAAAMARDGRPMVVLYSQAACSWCDQARSHLVPMARQPETAARALYRQIDLDSDAELVDFHGRRVTQRAFARAEKVRFTPTVVVYGPDGRQLGEPIIGMRLPDFYGQYVEQAIEMARERIAAPQPLNRQDR